jgi:hypothetical protein
VVKATVIDSHAFADHVDPESGDCQRTPKNLRQTESWSFRWNWTMRSALPFFDWTTADAASKKSSIPKTNRF